MDPQRLGRSAAPAALRTDGSLIASLDVPGAEAADWEDIAVGPGGDLLVGDIGDNDARRGGIDVYRVPEPRLADGAAATAPATRLRLTYPDGPHDAESLLADRRTGEIVIVTKRLSGRTGVYVARRRRAARPPPRPCATPATSSLGLGGLATAGDVSADGATIAVRTYTARVRLDAPPGPLAGRDDDGRRPCRGQAPLGGEGQGEALALSATAARSSPSPKAPARSCAATARASPS